MSTFAVNLDFETTWFTRQVFLWRGCPVEQSQCDTGRSVWVWTGTYHRRAVQVPSTDQMGEEDAITEWQSFNSLGVTTISRACRVMASCPVGSCHVLSGGPAQAHRCLCQCTVSASVYATAGSCLANSQCAPGVHLTPV